MLGTLGSTVVEVSAAKPSAFCSPWGLFLLILSSMQLNDLSVCWGFFKLLESFFENVFARVKLTFISENAFQHHQMEALKGWMFDLALRTLAVLQVETGLKLF